MNRKIGVILSYVMMIFEVLSTLLLTPFIIRSLGGAEYGVYKLSASITAYLLLLDLGVGNALIKYVSQYRVTGDKIQESRFIGLSTIYYLIIAIITAIVGTALVVIFPYVFATGLSDTEIVLGQKLLVISSINAVITLGTAPFTNIIIAYEKFAVSKVASIVSIVVRIGLTFAALYAGFGSIGILLVNLFTTVLCRLFYVLYCFFGLKISLTLKGITKPFIKEVVGYSSLILLQMIATQMNASLDQILIGALVAESAVIIGIYGIGSQIVQYFQSIGTAFTNVLMPGVVKLTNDKSTTSVQLTDEMVRIGRFVLMVLGIIFVGFIFYGKQFISLWVGADYNDAYFVTVLLMIAYTFILCQSIGGQILWAKNMHKEISIIKLIIVVLNVILTIILIKWNPLIGATIGTFISLFLGDVVLSNIVYHKKLGINIKNLYFGTLKGILPCLLLSALAGYLFSFVNLQGWLGLIINILVMVLVYGLTMLLFGFNQYEKKLIRGMLAKIVPVKGGKRQ